MEERLDILDEVGNPTGKSETSHEVHRLGLKHRAVHVWFLNSKKQLLLQKRSMEKASYPGYWDISAAGHISTGDNALVTAKRETQEELGLTPPIEAFQHLFELKEHVVINNGTYIADEFQDVYLVHMEVEPHMLTLQAEEVDEVKWVDLVEFEKWVKEKRQDLVPHEEEHLRLIEYIKYENKFDHLRHLLLNAYVTFYVWKTLQDEKYNEVYSQAKSFWGATIPSLQQNWLIELAKIYEDSKYSYAGTVISVYALALELPDKVRAVKAETLLKTNDATIKSVARLRDHQLAHNNTKHLLDPSKLLDRFPLKYSEIEAIFEFTAQILSLLNPQEGHGYMLDHMKDEAEKETKYFMKCQQWLLKKRKEHIENFKNGGVQDVRFPPKEELEEL